MRPAFSLQMRPAPHFVAYLLPILRQLQPHLNCRYHLLVSAHRCHHPTTINSGEKSNLAMHFEPLINNPKA
ncbi:hypothetical protein LY78DRAFT_664779 [Colletotrichum sublineola]|nr:hypothetical protein LY78DRAFT_664779 [Colletotrichum sublineola]